MGIAIDKMALLVITVVGIIVLVWLLSGPGKDYALALLQDLGLISDGTEESLEEAMLREAIQCAYYRCAGKDGKTGCEAVKETEWKHLIDLDQPTSTNLYCCYRFIPPNIRIWSWSEDENCGDGTRVRPNICETREDVRSCGYECEERNYEDSEIVDGDKIDGYCYCEGRERACPCDAIDEDNDGYVCDDESKAGAIRVELVKEPSILKPMSPPLELIYPSEDDCDPPGSTNIKVQKSLLIDPDNVAGTEGSFEECKKSCRSTYCGPFGCVIESAYECKLKPTAVYVWEEKGDYKQTPVIICAQPPPGYAGPPPETPPEVTYDESNWVKSGDDVATFLYSCPSGKHLVSCFTRTDLSQGKWTDDYIISFYSEDDTCYVVAKDRDGANEHKRKVGVFCSNTPLCEPKWGSWEDSDENAHVFSSPSCTSGSPVMCFGQTCDITEGECKDDKIISTYVANSYCSIEAYDTGDDEQKRKVATQCCDLPFTCTWRWKETESEENYDRFESERCEPDEVPISCATRTCEPLTELLCYDDPIVSIYIENNYCVAEAHDIKYGDSHKRKVGVLCCESS